MVTGSRDERTRLNAEASAWLARIQGPRGGEARGQGGGRSGGEGGLDEGATGGTHADGGIISLE